MPSFTNVRVLYLYIASSWPCLVDPEIGVSEPLLVQILDIMACLLTAVHYVWQCTFRHSQKGGGHRSDALDVQQPRRAGEPFDVENLCAAIYGEHNPERQHSRNGYRERLWETCAGSIAVKIPKRRSGSYIRPFLEPRRTAEKAMAAVLQDVYP